MAEWRAYEPKPIWEPDYQAFVKWYRGIYGSNAVVPPNDDNIMDTAAYRLWVERGQPGGSINVPEPEVTLEEASARWQPPMPAGATTLVPLPKGVTLTGKRKFIGEEEYAEGSDGRWYGEKHWKVPSVEMQSVAGGALLYDPTTEQYRDPSNMGVVPYADAQNIINQYNEQFATKPAKAPSISEQQWEISKNRREWAPGVNIEQDITTGKLYRPGSMVEVSPDIANAELLKAPSPTVEKAPSISEQQWKISQNRREWAPGVNIEQDITTGKLYRPGSMVEVSTDIATAELQKAQTGQIDWQKGATEADLAERRRQFDILQRQKAGEFEKEQSLLPQRMALQWELDRQRLLAGLPSEDWVTRGILELELKYANPYKQQTGTQEIGSLVSGLGSQLDRQTGQVQALEQMYVARLMGGDTEAANQIKEELTAAQTTRDATYQAWSGVKKEAADWSPQPPPQRQVYPFAPEWLPQWAPGQVAGKEISPENVMTPSGQQLTQMPQSRAKQLGYYADWTARMGKGRSWRDILGEAEIMQPYTPRWAGAATRWTPARM